MTCGPKFKFGRKLSISALAQQTQQNGLSSRIVVSFIAVMCDRAEMNKNRYDSKQNEPINNLVSTSTVSSKARYFHTKSIRDPAFMVSWPDLLNLVPLSGRQHVPRLLPSTRDQSAKALSLSLISQQIRDEGPRFSLKDSAPSSATTSDPQKFHPPVTTMATQAFDSLQSNQMALELWTSWGFHQ